MEKNKIIIVGVCGSAHQAALHLLAAKHDVLHVDSVDDLTEEQKSHYRSAWNPQPLKIKPLAEIPFIDNFIEPTPSKFISKGKFNFKK